MLREKGAGAANQLVLDAGVEKSPSGGRVFFPVRGITGTQKLTKKLSFLVTYLNPTRADLDFYTLVPSASDPAFVGTAYRPAVVRTGRDVRRRRRARHTETAHRIVVHGRSGTTFSRPSSQTLSLRQ